ncbi:conserved hypothetical protein [Pediculus humanus corporis]|uniref:Uncharacterized protein n=1 Tax=Pediculus humanus subsp. corporis TaxID=121224 RepID=E0VLC6_PEDHC|nr:uncharacterized protein Phum_PHUM286080 [Pediculus humanus corporis]EEB14182.1 conserved hypothetical protein [Pediculus humanus corporis]
MTSLIYDDGDEYDDETIIENKKNTARENGDRSLVVVLPFKGENKKNINELYTKKPFVKMIDTVKDLESDGSSYKDEIPNVTRRKDDVGTTEFNSKEIYADSFSIPVETTTETFEDVTKSYTNYINPEQVTQKFDNPVLVYSKPVKYNDDDDNEDWIKKTKEIDQVIDTLPKDMKKFIFELGLNKDNDNNDDKVGEKNEKNVLQVKKIIHPIIDAKSYSVFKPLSLNVKNDDKSLTEDMKTFLKSFGLYPDDVRYTKSIKENDSKKSINENDSKKSIRGDEISEGQLNFLPDDLKLVLEDMGLLKVREKNDVPFMTIHVFKPSNHSVPKSNEDIEKLNAILTSIKTTINKSKSLTPDVQSEITEKVKQLNTFKQTTKPRIARRVTKLFDGPDPLVLTDETLLKTDVKRQDNATDTSSASSSASDDDSDSENGGDTMTTLSPDTASDESGTVTESENTDLSNNSTAEADSNLEALKDSFGGGETADDSEDVDSSLPPKKPNGLYLLFDWNSFLEVGTEDDDRRVNLRFQPKSNSSVNISDSLKTIKHFTFTKKENRNLLQLNALWLF